MSRMLYFDTFNGVSGDMVLGALVHIGLPLDHLRQELAKLKLDGFELASEKIERQGLHAINIRVRVKEHFSADDGTFHEHPPTAHHESRGFVQIRQLIEDSNLDLWVKEKAVAIFRRLGEAEAKVHGALLDDVHFHEVGAVDAIVDIVGACIGFRYFGVDHFYTSPLNLGGGSVTFSHGTLPVPAPATAELVRGFPVILGTAESELTTPTGAAIVTTLVDKNSQPFEPYYEKWGFGAGDKELPGIPNVLKLVLGRSRDATIQNVAGSESIEGMQEEEILLLEASIDDMDAEMFGHFLELALDIGALDVYYTPLQMKKNRPGLLLSLLCRRQDQERMAGLVFRETTTLGIRWTPCKRWILNREVQQIETEYGPVRIKVGRFQGRVVNVWPEYEDLKDMAERKKVPLKILRQKVMEHVGKLKYE